MLRIHRQSKQAFFTSLPYSPLETVLSQHLGNKKLDSRTALDFFVNRRPDIGSCADIVFLQKLGNAFPMELPDHVKQSLASAAYAVELKVASPGDLSILIQELCETTKRGDLLGLSSVILQRAVDEYFSRPSIVSMDPRSLIRVMHSLPDYALIPDHAMGHVRTCLKGLSLLPDLSLEEIVFAVNVAVRLQIEVPQSWFSELSSVAPFVSPNQSVQLLHDVVRLQPPSAKDTNLHAVVSALKINVISSREVNASQRAVVISDLARVGALTSQARGLLSRQFRNLPLSHKIRVLNAVATCVPKPEPEDQFNLESSEMLKVLVEEVNKSAKTNIGATYALVAMGQLDVGTDEGRTTVKNFVDNYLGQKERPASHTPLLTQLVELSLLVIAKDVSQNTISSVFSQKWEKVVNTYIDSEISIFKRNSIVHDVALHVGLDLLTSEGAVAVMHENVPLPVLYSVDNETFIDVDIYSSSACSRKVRSLIAAALGIKYKVVDSLSWAYAVDKIEYMQKLLESGQESAFLCNTPTQLGLDIKPPPNDLPSKPKIAYIRKNDLK